MTDSFVDRLRRLRIETRERDAEVRRDPEGLEAGLRHERERFARLVVSDEGRAGIDRFLARRSLPLPVRPPPSPA